ncbi:type VI secretion system baseplate subunit TssG [Atlantibacter sp.]|uniref:type VI secretion system baseplate subunit TssG n=1 Tax=Atlantibacter sp. TaxID=1903473 RepID=UPI00289BA416|nr:type VI secretion system baseplate subunit TssG [Atlantibacter sp.]
MDLAGAAHSQSTDVMNDDNTALPPFWLDEEGHDRTALFNFYRFCQLAERRARTRLGEGRSPESDPIRLLPYPGMGFPAGELRSTVTDEEHPERPPVVRVNFMGLYGVESPLPTSLTDDITRGREGHEAMMAFLDIFNHRILTQYYRIWRKYHYPSAFEPGGTDAVSQSLMALVGITRSETPPASRLLALLPTLLHPTHTADGLAAVIEAQAERTRVEVRPHYPVMMPVEERARLSMDNRRTLGEYLILGDEIRDANFCAAVELYTDDPDEARGWMPDGQLRKDVMDLLRVYLGCDYDVRLWVTIPTRLLPRPRLGDRRLFAGYNVMLGLDDGPVADGLPKTVRIRVGRLRDHEFEQKRQQSVKSNKAESDEGLFVL